MKTTKISIGQVKRDISDLANRVAYGGEQVVLTSRGKPKAALISIEDYERLEQAKAQGYPAGAQGARSEKDQPGGGTPVQRRLRDASASHPSYASLKDQVCAQMESLPPDLQRRVLDFVEALVMSAPKGVPGKEMLRFAGTIPLADLQVMKEAIEAECERVDADGW